MVNSSEGLEHDGREYAFPIGCVYQIVSRNTHRWGSMLGFTRDGREYAPNEELWLTHLQTRVD